MATHPKPFPPTYLQRDKAIGADCHRRLVDTFNWLVDYCSNLKVQGDAAEFKQEPDSAHPIIAVDLSKAVTGGDGVEVEPSGEGGVVIRFTGGGGDGTGVAVKTPGMTEATKPGRVWNLEPDAVGNVSFGVTGPDEDGGSGTIQIGVRWA